MLVRGNSLKGSYRSYFLRNIKQLVAEIPADHRKAFAEDVKAKAALLGCKDEDTLRIALEHLTGEKGDGQ